MKPIIRLLFRHRLGIQLDKRQKFAIQTVILVGGILVTQLIWQDYRFYMVGILSFLSFILTAWSLSEDVKGMEWVLLFILPVLFTASVSLFYFLLPGRWITRLTVTVIFAVGTYAVLLVENIYNVAATRSIQLLRAAQSVGLLLTLVVVFLTTSLVFSFRASFLLNFLMIIPIIFLLSLQSLWSVRLDTKLNKNLLLYTASVSLGIGELALVLSFWPVQLSTVSLFVTASFYTMVGVIQQHFLERLFKNTIQEYLFAFLITFVLIFIATKWG